MCRPSRWIRKRTHRGRGAGPWLRRFGVVFLTLGVGWLAGLPAGAADAKGLDEMKSFRLLILEPTQDRAVVRGPSGFLVWTEGQEIDEPIRMQLLEVGADRLVVEIRGENDDRQRAWLQRGKEGTWVRRLATSLEEAPIVQPLPQPGRPGVQRVAGPVPDEEEGTAPAGEGDR